MRYCFQPQTRPTLIGVCPIKDCNQCGKCCIKYANGGLSATAEEIAWWESHRPDIAQFVRYEGGEGKIWRDPESGQPLDACPWLEQQLPQGRYTCSIYDERPDDCRHYPVTITEMVVDGCEMIEPKDLQNTANAQKTLDLIMSTSRPAAD